MKRAIAILLVLSAALALAACGADTAGESSQSPPPEQSAVTPSGDGNIPENTVPTPNPDNPSHVGYWDDPVDHFARPTYRAVNYQVYSDESLERRNRAMNYLGKTKMNIEFELFNANGDNEKFINSLDLYRDRDGMIIGHDYAAKKRVLEVLREMDGDFQWLNLMIPFQDDETQELFAPAVVLDGYKIGEMSTQWLVDNYKDYWGEVDTSKIGFIFLNLSTIDVFRPREAAAKAVWEENFPDNLLLIGDASGQQISAELVYNMITSFTTGHPEIEYWFINAAMMMFPAPAARAVETLGIADNVLITCCESYGVTDEWDAGAYGALVSCVASADDLLTAPAISGLIALIDGRATQETLWEDARQERYGSKYTMYPIEIAMVTPDTYKEYFSGVEAYFYGDPTNKPE
jgi:hypothetical protein